MMYQNKINQNRIDNYKQKTTLYIESLEKALIETKLKYKRKLERSMME